MAIEQRRLKRKEIRQDPLMKAIVRAQSWLPQYGRLLGIGAVIVLVAVIAVVMVTNMKRSANQEANLAMAQARQMISQGRKDQAISIFQDAADRYSHTQGGAEALYSLAEMVLADGNNEEALELFNRFEREYSKEFMLSLGALTGKATALENLGRFAEAATVYEQVFNRDKFGHYKPFALYQAARCRKLAGETVKAKEQLQRLIAEYPDSPLVMDAEQELAGIEVELATG